MRTYLIVVLSWVVYSAGATLGGIAVPPQRRFNPQPGILESVLMALAVVAAVIFRYQLTRAGWLPIFGSFVGLFVFAFVMRYALARRPVWGVGGSGDFIPLPQSPAPRARTAAGRAWEAWKRFGTASADFQGRVLLTLSYFTVVVPFALWVTYFKDPLRLRRATAIWHKRPKAVSSLDAARRQF